MRAAKVLLNDSLNKSSATEVETDSADDEESDDADDVSTKTSSSLKTDASRTIWGDARTPANSKIKRVLMPVSSQTAPLKKATTAKTPDKASSHAIERPRRISRGAR